MNRPEFTLIDLDQEELEGHRLFLGCWLYRTPDLVFLVDPGPASSAEKLVEELRAEGVRRLDAVLLTHIHIDHAGGTGHLLRSFPEARVYCHESGRRHLVDPARLWKGSRAVLGRVAGVYGAPSPVPEANLIDEAAVERLGVRVMPTPGHAPHHVSFVCGDALLVGEAIGTHCPLPGRRDDQVYLRPATPPRFFLDQAVASIDSLLALDPAPERILFAHYGERGEAAELLEAGREQLRWWTSVVAELAAVSEENLEERAHFRLLEEDPLYANFPALDEDIQGRERLYAGHTIQGMLGCLHGEAGK
ncbi:MAG: MBL fold metallo-hydrolase [Candidatus Eisenbacteria bacterium]|nr:MBL fold metallo-hydrolase [Candidatus Eisenbacteria bacterium]